MRAIRKIFNTIRSYALGETGECIRRNQRIFAGANHHHWTPAGRIGWIDFERLPRRQLRRQVEEASRLGRDAFPLLAEFIE